MLLIPVADTRQCAWGLSQGCRAAKSHLTLSDVRGVGVPRLVVDGDRPPHTSLVVRDRPDPSARHDFSTMPH